MMRSATQATAVSIAGGDLARRAQSSRRWRVHLGLRGTLGFAIVGVVIVMAVLGPMLAPADPIEQEISQRLRPPVWQTGGSSAHLLGTDQLGRDLFSRLLYGARISLTISIGAASFAAIVGVVLGLVSGYYRGWLDEIVMRLVEIQLAFPFLLLAITIMAVLQPSMRNVILVLAISGWVVYGRLVRANTLALAETEFVVAARALGCSDVRIIFRHILPNLVGVATVVFTLQVAQFIIAESALSFLGLGVQPPQPSWGTIMNEGREYLNIAWWVETFPGIAILIATTGIGLLGDWLRDVLDPRLRV
jgi:peptide/nickel transport system permease protein